MRWIRFALRVRIAMELASGLEALHDAHIAHADVKCANVLLDAQMHAALTVQPTTLSNPPDLNAMVWAIGEKSRGSQ